jgi:hypothetical protein
MVPRFYGIVDLDLDEVIFWYVTREEAEAERRKMIGDEPQWVETMRVVMIDFAGPEPIVEYVS